MSNRRSKKSAAKLSPKDYFAAQKLVILAVSKVWPKFIWKKDICKKATRSGMVWLQYYLKWYLIYGGEQIKILEYNDVWYAVITPDDLEKLLLFVANKRGLPDPCEKLVLPKEPRERYVEHSIWEDFNDF